MFDYLAIFGIGYVSVFALGFQSRNVNNGNYGWAAATSFFIGLTSAFLWNNVPADMMSGIVYGSSGAAAIMSSMYIHERFIKNGRRSRNTG